MTEADAYTKVGPLDGSLLDQVIREALDDSYLYVHTEPDLVGEILETSSRKDLRALTENEAPRALSSYALGDLAQATIEQADGLSVRTALLPSAERLLRYREMEITVMRYLLALPDAREASMKAAKIAQGRLVQDQCRIQARSDTTGGTARYGSLVVEAATGTTEDTK